MLEVLQDYIKDKLASGLFQQSTSEVGVSILFVGKKDGSFCLCVNYRQLNLVISKNCYPFFPILETRDRVVSVQI